MSQPSGANWVSAVGVAWALDDAPCPADLLGTLIAVARRADQFGRGSRQSVATIAEKAGKSAQQARRDLGRLKKLGLLLDGDPALVAHLPVWQRPSVYDLPLHVKGPKPIKKSPNPTGGKKIESVEPTPMDAPPTTGGSTPMDGGTPPPMGGSSPPTTHGRQKKPLNNPSEESSSSRDPHTALVADRLEIEDEEASRLIQKITEGKAIGSLGAYLKSISDQDYRMALAELRTPPPAPKTSGKKPWCGKCDEHSRWVTEERGDGRTVAYRCPTCGPSPAGASSGRDSGRSSTTHFRNYPDPDEAYKDYEQQPDPPPWRRRPRDGRDVSTAEELRSWDALAARDEADLPAAPPQKWTGPFKNPEDMSGYHGQL